MKTCQIFSFVILQTIIFIAPCFAKTLPANGGHVTVIIEPVYNGKPLKLNSQYYITGHGDTLYIDLFRFYLTNLKLSAGSAYIKYPDSHLIDAGKVATLTFYIDNVPSGSFTSLQFTTGVDSATNASGVNGGDLDHAKDMWAENSGYINAKLEGRSKVCKTAHHTFEFHIAGYASPYNTSRNISIELPHPIDVASKKNIIIHIKADAATLFRNIGLAKMSTVVKPGKEAVIIASNYAEMFSISGIESE